MFTGVIERLGEVVVSKRDDGALLLTVAALDCPVAIGDSVAINGVCLTVTAHDAETMTFWCSSETLHRTRLDALSVGDAVNIERALPATGRFDGHIVSGHIDGIGTIRSLTPENGGHIVWCDAPPPLLRYLAEKGSVAIDGISLTINTVDENGVAVMIIPHTRSHTNIGRHWCTGAVVRIEVDMLARYVARLLQMESMNG